VLLCWLLHQLGMRLENQSSKTQWMQAFPDRVHPKDVACMAPQKTIELLLHRQLRVPTPAVLQR
jgi:hypothetical protein